MLKHRYKEVVIYKNRKGRIVKIVDALGSVRYILLDRNGAYIKDVKSPSKAAEYLQEVEYGQKRC